MKVTLLQTDIAWASPKENIRRLDELFQTVQKSDLYILPEMFSTGFVTDPVGVAESDQLSLCWMKRISEKTGSAIAGSIAIDDGGKYYNRFYFVKPDGSVSSYDKHHLFSFAGEHRRYTAGRDRVIVEYGGIRFLLLVCYDLRFPVWIRNREDYDAILIVASWPDCRRQAWDLLLRARAIENQCYVLSVNRQGNDPGNYYSGGTYLIDPLGNIVNTAGDDNGLECSSVTFDLDISDLETKYRPSFPVLKDGDKFELQ